MKEARMRYGTWGREWTDSTVIPREALEEGKLLPWMRQDDRLSLIVHLVEECDAVARHTEVPDKLVAQCCSLVRGRRAPSPDVEAGLWLRFAANEGALVRCLRMVRAVDSGEATLD
jgi:hypothetical protein